MRTRRLTVAVAAGAIAVGAAGVVAYPAFADTTPTDPPSTSATPSTPPSTTSTPGTPSTPSTPATPGKPGAPGGEGDARQSRIKDALKSLVEDGTLTQEQADKVAEKLAGSGVPGGIGSGGPHLNLRAGGAFGVALDEVAKALGLSRGDVESGLAGGKSIKELAEAQGKDVNDVIDALVTAAGTKIDQAVKDGKLEQDAADQLKSQLKERITALVENGLPKLPGPGQPGGDGPRLRHWGGQGEDETPAPGTPSSEPTGPDSSDSSFSGVA